MAFQAVIVSFASYLVWFQLLRRYRAAQLGVLSFMTPLFGVVMAAVLLGDQLTPSFLARAALVVAGLVLVNGQAWRNKKATASAHQGGATTAQHPA